MKTPSDDLFTLIKSLDIQEKVFFKTHIKKRGLTENLSYLKLFDAINKLNAYDEPLLMTHLKKTGFTHHFKFAKSYLIETILNSLEEYHSASSVNSQIHKLLHRAELLINKKLLDLAKKNLLKAENLIMEQKVYDYMPVIFIFKKDILRSSLNVKDMEDYLRHGMLKEKEYLERLKNTIEFRNFSCQLLLRAATYATKAPENEYNTINSILNSSLLSSPDKALSFSSLRDYYSIHIICSTLLDKCDARTIQRQKEWVTYLESDTIRFPERTNAYLTSLVSLMSLQIKMNRMDEVFKSYEKIKQFYFSLAPKKRTKQLSDQFIAASANYMHIHFMNGHPEQSIKIWEEIKSFVFFNQLDNNLFLVICANLSHNYFMLDNYHEALKWINETLNFRKKNIFEVQAMARIYSLVIHYELGNYDMLPYIAKSAQRFLLKHNYFSEFEKIMVDFFEKKIHKTNNQQEQSETFRQLKKQLETLLKNTKQIHALEYFDYASWIESKIENRPFAEIVREKAKLAFIEK